MLITENGIQSKLCLMIESCRECATPNAPFSLGPSVSVSVSVSLGPSVRNLQTKFGYLASKSFITDLSCIRLCFYFMTILETICRVYISLIDSISKREAAKKVIKGHNRNGEYEGFYSLFKTKFTSEGIQR